MARMATEQSAVRNVFIGGAESFEGQFCDKHSLSGAPENGWARAAFEKSHS
jgi:hypothetical protein